MVGKMGYLAMKTDYVAQNALIGSDLRDLGNSLQQLANHALLGGGLGFGTSLLKWIAFLAAVYLLVLDRTNWKTNMLTALLIPYIFLTLPHWLFGVLRGEIGKWIAFIAVIVRLFFPRHFIEWLELPLAFILIVVVAPYIMADVIRDHWVGLIIALIIGVYLLQEHIRSCGGFKNAFTRGNGITNSIGILLLFIYPVWAIVLWIL
ncbi:hypothetical protein F511_07041 [Dorcoceras hygrometricum]|uniref:Cold-regulated 413 plasma membrane protein 2-like n=1 Tax=Dorcoceras hygrometricum TaxID=472368 RepID=A0A2Z7D5V3_9LAMI|nr:hypothetical protein F511_07041 [Dorcoceras hygrometricum]